jgi:hypothetical protein
VARAAGSLLVGADWFGQRALNRLDLATRAATMVGARGARSVDVDRAGNVVFENATYSTNLFLIDPSDAAARPRELWPSTRYTNQAEFSPDGTRVLFVSNRDGAGAVYVAAIDGAPRRILGADDFAYMRPHWSRDGHFVYAVRLTRREDGERVQQAVRADADTGRTELLGALGTHVFDVHESADGALVVGELAGTRRASCARARRPARPSACRGPGERIPGRGDKVAFMQPSLPGSRCATSRRCGARPSVLRSRRQPLRLAADARRRVVSHPRTAVRSRSLRSRAAGDHVAQRLRADCARPLARGQPGCTRAARRREAPPVIDLMYAPPRARGSGGSAVHGRRPPISSHSFAAKAWCSSPREAHPQSRLAHRRFAGGGSWWAHPQSHAIYRALQGVRASRDVMACRLVAGKVTLVHRRLWPIVSLLQPRIRHRASRSSKSGTRRADVT